MDHGFRVRGSGFRKIRDRNAHDRMIRLGCFLSWALFRQRIVLDDHPVLGEFQRRFEADPAIAATHPEKSA